MKLSIHTRAILACAKDGMTDLDIAIVLGRSEDDISKTLRKHAPHLRRDSSGVRGAIETQLKAGARQIDIARTLGVSPGYVSQVARKMKDTGP